MTWLIRQVIAAEADLVLPLLEQVQAIHAAAHPEIFRADTDRAELLTFLQDMLGRDGMTGLVAMGPDGAAVGYAICDVEVVEPSPLRHGQRRGVLHQISVDTRCRRGGVRSALVEEVKVRLREQGIGHLQTSYWLFNEPSAALMRKSGLSLSHVKADGPI